MIKEGRSKMKMLLLRTEFAKRFPKSQTRVTTCSNERNKRVFYFPQK